MRAYETLRHTITKPIEDKTNQNKKRGQNQREEIQKNYIPSNYPRECWLRIKTITTVEYVIQKK